MTFQDSDLEVVVSAVRLIYHTLTVTPPAAAAGVGPIMSRGTVAAFFPSGAAVASPQGLFLGLLGAVAPPPAAGLSCYLPL